MPKLTRKLPAYRLHKPSGRAVVTLGGKDFYLGPHGSQESKVEYDRLIAEWLASPTQHRATTTRAGSDLTVNELLRAWWAHADTHYRSPSGERTGEFNNFKDTLKPLRAMYGTTIAREFSPLKLKAFRRTLIEAGISRGTINQRIGRIVAVFKWAVSEEMINAEVQQALKSVAGLAKGRTTAREPDPVRPIADEAVEAVLPHVADEVRAMIRLQQLTGMRPGEVVILRSGDVDRSGETWIYQPSHHKTAHAGKGRSIAMGPQAQAVLAPWLVDDPDAFAFSPKAAQERGAKVKRAARRTKVQPSQRDRSKAGARRRPGARYTVRSYYHAIARGCDLAFPHPTLSAIPRDRLADDERKELAAWRKPRRFGPHRLRHTAATRIRKAFDLDTARAILGHSTPVVTEVYAEIDMGKAVTAMRRIG